MSWTTTTSTLSVVETKFQAELKWTPVEGLDLSALGAVKYQGFDPGA